MSAGPADPRWVELKQRFAAIDGDGDGYITRAEITEHFPHLPAEALGALDRHADTDGDGRISFDEFARIAQPDG
ncbi:hypothetical protein Sru01_62820 [Sphaerisporangium rufum]|uniref:EF-hand domain-containing protein n=1 Tax=Sphaerisporangium rufum TaxID=1381558 RepID=A0A919V8F5_9ACTN|nr:EF-hand domain-containing protein [Sphaerisporangium rufum]GII81300.1 hypothetical protein Sru01_62820 [Sphaerisporangium rufum]